MAKGLLTLTLFSIAMAAASFGAGMLPLTLTLTKPHLRLISTLGMGVLIGTSLIVIIPEGIETLYSITSLHKHSDHDNDDDDSDDEDNHSSYNPHTYVGLALITGFILMYLIDTLPAIIAARTNRSKRSYITLSSLQNNTTTPDPDTPSSPTLHSTQPSTTSSPSSSSFSTTLGLVIHSLADGIALGASSTSSNLSLSFIIFLAILLHKAPASFALSSVLLKSGLSKRTARTHLLIFSLAAPTGALATWAVVSILGGVDDKAKMAWWTGVLLLFSGGTFLYVAMHTMQAHAASHEGDGERGEEGSGYMMKKGEVKGGTVGDTVVAVVGMLVPLVTQVGHAGH